MRESSKRKSPEQMIATTRSWSVWQFFAETSRAYEFSPDGASELYEAVNSGDAVLLTNREGTLATGVRRIYLKRFEGERVIFYFDRCVDFKSPVSVNLVTSGNAEVRRIEWTLLEGILQLEELPNFEQLPMPDPKDKENQRNVRDLLQVAVADDLLGPAGGAHEEIIGMSVRDRYVLGRLAPQTLDLSADVDSDEEDEEIVSGNPDHISRKDSTATSPADEEEERENDQSANRSLTPSSLGFTFCIDRDLTEIELEVSWGRYVRTESATAVNERTDKPVRCWKRVPSGDKVTIPVKTGPIKSICVDQFDPEIVVQGEVTEPFENGSRLMTLFLVNTKTEPRVNRDSAWVFQPKMRVFAKDRRPAFVQRPFHWSDAHDLELQSLDMIYRKDVEFAVGHGISVHVTTSQNDYQRAVEIETLTMPSYEVPVTETPGSEEEDREALKNISRKGILDMRLLAEMGVDELSSALSLFVDDYAQWLDEQAARAQSDEFKSKYGNAAEQAVDKGRSILARLREGIDVLQENKSALKAFQFANHVMADQRVHSLYALSQRRNETKSGNLKDFDTPKNHTWRPFQLAFILLSIPSLANPAHPYRTDAMEAVADLLWFPTGGGKTEAYLGVAAFAMAMRRLEPDVGGRDGSRGLAVIMRYTLRLLTIQQFQRAATLVCAMEVARRKNPKIWGTTPFTLGLWVGNKVTPGTTEKSHDAIQNIRDNKFGVRETPAQLTTCPWCGAEISPGREIRVDLNTKRTRIFCGDSHGRCEFCHSSDNSDGLPVVVVDEEMYHNPPSMLIATVDKFAMMAWKGAVRTLFGEAEAECPRHGLIFPDDPDCNGIHKCKGSLPATTPKPVKKLRPPDLIIQDEFHLISGPLGSMVGLYETAIDELCSWKLDGKLVRPKIIASTATVRKAAEQVNNVFFRKVSIFPQHGLDVTDNFFAVRRPVEKLPGRRYLGICSPGTSRPALMIRVYVALLTAAKNLHDSFGPLADPYMTLVGYFNSLRELGGMRRLCEDDVQVRSYRVDKAKNKIARPGLKQRKIKVVDELTSRVSNRDIPKKLDQLEIKYKSDYRKNETRAIDIVLASNMLSVGVDVNRLGLMVVNGQPKNTAEYIQATSRVGRAFPGLVCTVLTWARPRDFSHYETFENYHRTFYKHVEAQSVTPFAARAMDRGLTGVMTSLMRHSDLSLNPNLGAGALNDAGHLTALYANAAVQKRTLRVTEKVAAGERASAMGKDRIDCWVKQALVPGRKLGYDKPSKNGGEVVALLTRAGTGTWDKFTVPMSMREVESDVRLIMDKSMREPGNDPAWEHCKKSESKEEGEPDNG